VTINIRGSAKQLVERTLNRVGAAWVGARRAGGDTLVLAYHNVVPDGHEAAVGERSLHLPQAAFAAQLDALLRTHEVVRLNRIFDAAPVKKPRAVITFDDVYRGAMQAGVAELTARSLPATFFVSPGLLGRDSFWWDAMAAATGGELPSSERDHALTALAGRDEAVRSWASSSEREMHPSPPHAQPVTEGELVRAVAAAGPGITLGSHGWSHVALPGVDRTDLRRELTRSLEWLRVRFRSRVIPWISYPYGLSSPEVEAEAGAAGYAGGLCISGGWIGRNGTSPFSLPRLNVPSGITLHGFRLRSCGVLAR
jgi:peptidoglycan/xylan/chitin deacetylase (PgdA/CDA1 family)